MLAHTPTVRAPRALRQSPRSRLCFLGFSRYPATRYLAPQLLRLLGFEGYRAEMNSGMYGLAVQIFVFLRDLPITSRPCHTGQASF
jgi:hypothetical protein